MTEIYITPLKVYSWVLDPGSEISYLTLLGLSNSKLLWWFMKRTADTLKDDARTFKTNYLNPFPVPKGINQELIYELDSIVTKRQAVSGDGTVLDKQIDQLVYKIYHLSPEEIQIIEESVVWGWEKMS